MIYPDGFIHFCSSMKYKLTSLRKSILFILWHDQRPLKAYEILNQLQQVKQNSKPPTVYRVLDYLVNCGIVHKIESIQSYTLCHEPSMHQSSEVLMVCNNCHQVSERYDPQLSLVIQGLTVQSRFQLSQDPIELKGICQDCR